MGTRCVLQQLLDRRVVGVVGGEVAVVVDDRVDRIDGFRGRVHHIHEGDDVFLVRHGHGAAADAEAADAGDRLGEVSGGEGLVDPVQAELIVQVVVEAGPVVAGPGRERDAQGHVFIQDGHPSIKRHETPRQRLSGSRNQALAARRRPAASRGRWSGPHPRGRGFAERASPAGGGALWTLRPWDGAGFEAPGPVQPVDTRASPVRTAAAAGKTGFFCENSHASAVT